MAVGTGIGFDFTKLEKQFEKLDKQLEALTKKGKNFETTMVTAFKNMSKGDFDSFATKIKDLRKNIVAFGKQKVGLKWDSTSLQSYIDNVNRLIYVIKQVRKDAAGSHDIKGISILGLKKELKDAQELLRLVKRAEKTAEMATTGRSQTYAGAMRYSAKANTLEKERQAIENLKVARDKLKQTDADYAIKLNALNEAILKHEKHLKDATKTNSQKAEESAKDAQRQLKEEQRLYAERAKLRREENRKKNQTYEGALSFSASAKTLNREIQAVKNLEAARAKLSKTDADYQKKLDEINKRILQHNKNIAQATAGAKDLESAHSKLGSKIATVFSIQAIRGYVNQMIKVRGEMELQQRSIQAILQNKAEANEVWQKTIDLAVRSPFRIKDLVTYTKQLAAYRVEADKLYDTNKMLADVSAGLGVDMNRLILAFGQVKSANFLRGTELRQFTEAGIPMLDELAKLYEQMEGATVTAADVFDRISKRMVLFEDVEEVFKRMTAAGGTFYRMQEIQSETLKGQISNLKDSVDIMLNSMGEDMDGALKKSVKAVKFLVDNYEALIPVLKAIIAYLAIYKVNAFVASEATLRLARAMKIANISATGLGGAWTSLRVGLAKLGKDLGKTMTMLASHPWLLLAAAIVTAGVKLNQFRKELNEVDKKYDQLLDKQGDVYLAFRQAGQKGDLEEQIAERRKQLQALVDMAKNEYGLVLDINVGKVDETKLEEEFNKIRQKLIELNAFSRSFSKEMIKSDKASKWFGEGTFGFEEGMFEDIEDLGDAYSKLNHEMIRNVGRTTETLRDQWGELSNEQKKAVEDLEKPIQGNETLVDYVDRLKNAYNELLSSGKIKNNKIERFIKTFNRDVKEANDEFKLFANRFRDEVNNIADEKEKVEFLDVSIGAMADEKKWSEFEENYIRRLVEQEFGITFVPKTATHEELKNWQKSYNSLFEGGAGFREITATATSQSQVIERLNGTYDALQDTIEKIEAAGEDSVLAGGAYEGKNIDELRSDLKEVKKQLDWFGAKGKADDSTNKILNNRISLVKELNKKYEELNKTFDKTTSKEKVIESYSQTFQEAFKGTGIDLTTRIVDEQKLKEAGAKAGETFSEGMKESMTELVEKGIYTRDLDDSAREAALNFIKNFEGVRNKAYKDIGSKKWAIGIGNNYDPETGKEITENTVWSDEDIMRKNKIAMQKHMDALNKILDLHKDIIVTGEQYTALLDLTWQTGGAAALTYAEDRDKFKNWLEQIDKMPIVQVMKDGTRKKTGIFDIDVDQIIADYDRAETAIEKVAIAMEYVGMRNAVDKDTTEFMIKRAQERAKLFKGDLEVTKLIEKSTVNIANMDFTNLEGVAAMLKSLVPLAKKEGKDAYLALQRAISQVEVEIGVNESQEEAKKLNDEIQSLFDRYDLSLDLKKLNIPKDLAKSLFDIDYLDLDGLRKAVTDRESEFIGTKQEEEYKKFIDKIDDMENKAAVERMKTYSKYLMEGMSERIKLKIEEMRKLKEIEESKEFTPEQKARIKEGVSKEARKEQQAQEWKEFQESEMYTMMFEDIEFMGTKALEVLKEKLEELKGSLKDLPASEVKEIINQISKIEDITIERNPFESLREALREVRELEAKGRTEEALQQEFAKAEVMRKSYQDELDAVNLIISAQERGLDLNEQSAEWQEMYAMYLGMQTEELEEQALVLSTLAAGQGFIATNAKNDLDAYVEARKALKSVSEQWGTMNELANKAWSSAKDIMTSLGVESDSLAMTIGDTAMNMVDLVFQAVMFDMQLKVMTAQAELLGVAMNTALGPIGWIVLALQAVATLLTAIFSAKDKALQKQVESQLATVEKLQEGYENLESAIDNAWDTASIRQYNQELKNATRDMIAAQEAAINAQKQRKGALKEGTDANDELLEMEKELEELKTQLEESLAESFSKVSDGILDSVHDAARDFTDAWYDAFAETGDGVKGLEENFNEMFMNLAKQQASMQITGAFVDRWKKDLEKYINDTDTELTTEEARQWANEVKASFPELNNALEAFLGTIHESVGSFQEGGSLSELQKGIQGITEDTAQVIEAYMNSIRGYVSEQVTHTRNIYRILNDAVHSDAAAIRVRMV